MVISAQTKQRWMTAGAELLVVVLVWQLMGLAIVLVGALAAVIVFCAIVPFRWEWAATLAGFIGLAALCYFYFGSQRLAVVFLILGVVFGGFRAMKLKPRRA